MPRIHNAKFPHLIPRAGVFFLNFFLSCIFIQIRIHTRCITTTSMPAAKSSRECPSNCYPNKNTLEMSIEFALKCCYLNCTQNVTICTVSIRTPPRPTCYTNNSRTHSPDHNNYWCTESTLNVNNPVMLTANCRTDTKRKYRNAMLGKHTIIKMQLF